MVAFGLSKSCLVVIRLIINSGEALTQKAIIDATHLSARTVKYAVKRLEQQMVIYAKDDFLDLRSKRYYIMLKSNKEAEK